MQDDLRYKLIKGTKATSRKSDKSKLRRNNKMLKGLELENDYD